MKRVIGRTSLLRVQPDIAKRLKIDVPAPGERTISPNEAAALLGITGEAVKQWVYHGRLPAVKLHNGYWRIKVSDLSAFLDKRLGPPKHSVLICESDRATVSGALSVISELGHEGIVANSSIDAILKARNERPSVIILDLTHNDGWMLMQRMDESLARNVLLLASGKETPEQITKITESGAKAVLHKPLDIAILERELERITGRKN